jgi:hypothetical protein
MLKSVIQMIIIDLQKTLGKHDEDAHLFLYLFLTFAFFIHSVRYKPFNYPRVSMWHTLSLAGVYWLALVNTLDHMTEENLAYVILLFVGWGCLIIAGLIIQAKRIPSMLITQQHPDLL